ncbi:hypothetical protein [Coraliomargarita parva]|uniref:hypothetical protein n=1 Tax=Coraliomargarita parva TaxID=3014050 RepID=UPI0022B31E55|nr:hypothetical protein [Coraliomargarita parva]
MPEMFLAAIALTVAQGIVLWVPERSVTAFPVQLRIAYLGLLIVCYLPSMRWLYWLPTVGTFALVLFGYCLMARFLSLLPWNSSERYSLDRLRRTFFSAPDLSRLEGASHKGDCAGGLCTIEAQVAPADKPSTD